MVRRVPATTYGSLSITNRLNSLCAVAKARRCLELLAPIGQASQTMSRLSYGLLTLAVSVAVLALIRARRACQEVRYRQQVAATGIADERRRIARELHDGPVQWLYAIALRLESRIGPAEGLSEAERDEVRHLLEMIRRVMADIRIYVMNLEKDVTQSLPDLLGTLVDEMQGATSVPLGFETEAMGQVALSAAQADHLLQLAREALSNAIRHSSATHIGVALRREGTGLELAVCDDGQGFDPTRVGQGHHGMRNMRERARLLQATLHIESTPGAGTVVRLKVPSEGGT